MAFENLPPGELESKTQQLVQLLHAKGFSCQDAEDCVQEALVKILAKAHDIRSLWTWLAVAALHHGITMQRRNRRLVFGIDVDQVSVGPASLLDAVEDEESSQLIVVSVQTAIRRLPEKRRQVVNRRMKDETFISIGAELGISERAVRGRFNSAIKSLRRLLKHLCP